ncbi:MAG: aminoacyl-histidine dipeptidase [Clostridium butyricum]|nr:aminoacyl-histidine dipeptidase [Clostridium butyricum]
MKKIQGIKHEKVFKYFEDISRIPRESGNEKEISNYLLQFGRNLKLECIQDGVSNIIIKKRATKGYENSPTVIIQGHMDMVCEKNSNKEHDFSKDPIELIVKGDYIYADKTTLGGDSGIAIAYAMALLEDDTLEHPDIEVLFTTGEEIGMTGARAVQEQYINGKILLNLNAEQEGKLLVGCSGGIRTKSVLPIEWIDEEKENKEYVIVVKGLKGGDTGSDIQYGRGNANKLMGRVLKEILNEININLISINGGAKNNAIPRECTAVLSVSAKYEKVLFDIKRRLDEMIKRELIKKDPDVRIYLLESQEKYEKVFSNNTTEKIINLLYLYPNGVNTMNSKESGIIESSTNLGIVKTNEDYVELRSCVRSSILSIRNLIAEKNRCLTEIIGGTFSESLDYSVWKYKSDSKILDICKECYLKKYGEEAEVTVVHRGIECSIFGDKFDKIDMISFGPNIFETHTPNEHISISSADRCYEYLIDVLKSIK